MGSMGMVFFVGPQPPIRVGAALQCFLEDHLPADTPAIYDRGPDDGTVSWVLEEDVVTERRYGDTLRIPPPHVSDEELEQAAEMMLLAAADRPNTHFDLTWPVELTIGGRRLQVSESEFVGIYAVWPDSRRGLALHNHNAVRPVV